MSMELSNGSAPSSISIGGAASQPWSGQSFLLPFLEGNNTYSKIDFGVGYLNMYTDQKRIAYVLKPGETRLPAGISATTVTGDYPDDYYELTSPSDSDMFLRPDPDTVRMVPWAADPTAQVIHDCYTKDGRPHELAPRNVLRRVLAEYEKEGLRPVVAPELEFFLVQKNTDPDFPLLPPAGRSGRPETARQSYSIDAVNEFDPIPDLMYDYALAAEKLGKVDAMETALRKVMESVPDNHHAYNALGYSLADRNIRLDEAYELIGKAPQVAPGNP